MGWVYKCEICTREFTDIVDLLAHVEREHAEDPRVARLVHVWRSIRGAGLSLSRYQRFLDLAEERVASRYFVRARA